jgi:hypothetical protein
MSILRKLIIAALACAAAIAAPSVALASTTQPATAQHAAKPGAIQRAPCTRLTFDVYYGTSKRACYAGNGSLVVNIPNVHLITTGENRGLFRVRVGAALEQRFFLPNETFFFGAPRTELVFLQLDPLTVTHLV